MSSIATRIRPALRDLGDLTVARALPDKARQAVGPFVFFDHFGPADFEPGTGLNVRAHPHIGLATITYLFEGEILHRDNLGYVQPIRPGAVNWMTAGRGIVHSEKVTQEILASGQRLHGLQTWVALPLEHEETAPRFEHYAAGRIPGADMDGAQVRVIVGSAYGLASPVQSESDTLYVEVKLAAGSAVALPAAEELAVYVVSGRVAVDGDELGERELSVLEDGHEGRIEAATGAHLVLCGGGRLDGRRTVWWNFVSSSRERIEQAKRDWNEGRFDPIPGETDFIPLPD
ncbi:MAG: pirin family protein [Woeseiaceae bacterium]|nr:pirin family protein [Woeseiaceae bacterium]